jgi:hypothetical protein
MPRYPTASTLASAVHRLIDTGQWILFVEVPRLAGGYYRLVKGDRNVEAAAASAGGSTVKWVAAAIEVGPPDEDADGTLGDLSLSIPNPSRLAMAAVEAEGELLGQTVTLTLAHSDLLPSLAGAVTWRHTIVRAEITEAVARFTCGHEGAGMSVPSGVIDRFSFPQVGS